VALFVGRAGDLYVLLSQQVAFLYHPILKLMPLGDRRAKTLSSYAGDTALPGGRVDDEDKTIEDTAVRSDGAYFLISLTGLSLRDEKHSRRSYFYCPLLPDVIRADDRADWPSTGQDQTAPTMYP
jgi:hypothetical protein